MQNEQSPSRRSVVSLEDYRNSIEPRLDPANLDDAEIIDSVLAMATHPTVGLDPHGVASRVLELLGESSRDDWAMRASEISIEAGDLDDAEYEVARKDEVFAALLALINSRNGRLDSNKDIRDAVRALINFRAGAIASRHELKECHIERWNRLVANLGRVAT